MQVSERTILHYIVLFFFQAENSIQLQSSLLNIQSYMIYCTNTLFCYETSNESLWYIILCFLDFFSPCFQNSVNSNRLLKGQFYPYILLILSACKCCTHIKFYYESCKNQFDVLFCVLLIYFVPLCILVILPGFNINYIRL